MPQVDVGTLLLVGAGLAAAVSFAVLAGVLTARVFSDAAEVVDRP